MSAMCSSCGAPLEGRVTQSGVVVCAYCGSAHDVRGLAGRGALIVAADFSRTPVGGWQNGPKLVGGPIGGAPPAWAITQKHDGLNHPLLWAPGQYDDFDLSLAVRFVACGMNDALLVKGRNTSAGSVAVHLFPGGTLKLGWQQPDKVWKDDLAVVETAAKGLGTWRRLRWLASGARHRVWVDGQLSVSATHDPIRHSGYLDVRLRVMSPETTVELAELALHEPPA